MLYLGRVVNPGVKAKGGSLSPGIKKGMTKKSTVLQL